MDVIDVEYVGELVESARSIMIGGLHHQEKLFLLRQPQNILVSLKRASDPS